ncbi:MAG: DUF6787 family protein, partial [Litorivicinaceae bacterium]
MQKLMALFKADSPWQLIVIFTVFSVTGSASVILAAPVLQFFEITTDTLSPWIFWPLRIL